MRIEKMDDLEEKIIDVLKNGDELTVYQIMEKLDLLLVDKPKVSDILYDNNKFQLIHKNTNRGGKVHWKLKDWEKIEVVKSEPVYRTFVFLDVDTCPILKEIERYATEECHFHIIASDGYNINKPKSSEFIFMQILRPEYNGLVREAVAVELSELVLGIENWDREKIHFIFISNSSKYLMLGQMFCRRHDLLYDKFMCNGSDDLLQIIKKLR